MLAGVQEMVELGKGFGRIAAGSGIDEVPDAFGAPAADDFLHLLGGGLGTGRNEQSELGQILIEQAELGAGQIEQDLGGVAGEGHAMLGFAPRDDPFGDGSFVDVFAFAFLLRRAAIDLEAGLIEGFVEAGGGEPVVDFEDENACGARLGGVVFELGAVGGDEGVGTLQDNQARLAAAEKGASGKLIGNVAPVGRAILTVVRGCWDVFVGTDDEAADGFEDEALQKGLFTKSDDDAGQLAGGGCVEEFEAVERAGHELQEWLWGRLSGRAKR